MEKGEIVKSWLWNLSVHIPDLLGNPGLVGRLRALGYREEPLE